MRWRHRDAAEAHARGGGRGGAAVADVAIERERLG
jgi:hypothetical protein